MRKFVLGFSLCLVVFLVTASSVMGAPVPCPSSGTGTGGAASYADLLATNPGGGCFIADKLFTSFTFAANATGGATALTANQMSYLIDNLVPVGNGTVLVGFEFSMSLNASAGQSNDIHITYNVQQINGVADITSVHNLLTGIGINGGTASVAEVWCTGLNLTGTCNALNTSNPGNPHNDASFAGISQLSISKDINVTAGNGFASISGLRNAIDETRGGTTPGVPEPATASYLLGGAGLLALGWLRRKSTKS